MRSCRLSTAFTIVRPSITTPPKSTASSGVRTSTSSAWSALMAAFPQGSFLVGLSSIPWREAWKYGERAFRYCQHDVGHALAAMRISAAALGWRLFLFSGATDAGMAKLLGLDRDIDYGHTEREHSDLIALVTPAGPDGPLTGVSLGLPEQTLHQTEACSWYGKANALSPAHGVDWPVIEEVVRATCRRSKAPMSEDFSRFASEEELFGVPVRSGSLSAESVILGRRSAVSMDGTTSISAETFFRMLARLVPTRDRRSMPWDAIPWTPRIHLGLFVHRVRRATARPLRTGSRSGQGRDAPGRHATRLPLAAAANLPAGTPPLPS